MVLLVSLSNFSVVFHGSVSTDESLFFSCSTLQENFVSFSIDLQTVLLRLILYNVLIFVLPFKSFLLSMSSLLWLYMYYYYTCISAMLLTTSALFLSVSCLMKYKFLSLTSSLTETCTIAYFSSSFCADFFHHLFSTYSTFPFISSHSHLHFLTTAVLVQLPSLQQAFVKMYFMPKNSFFLLPSSFKLSVLVQSNYSFCQYKLEMMSSNIQDRKNDTQHL